MITYKTDIMKKICLCFQIHQPFRLRRYRFFDIGHEHFYTDDYLNEEIFARMAEESYLPANRMMLELLREHPEFCLSYSISGLALEQMEYVSPALLDSFKELVATGRVELLSETYAHSLTALYDTAEWHAQIAMHRAKVQGIFGIAPSKVLCNTELIYSDEIATEAALGGFKGVITEGARHIMGWKSSNYIYSSPGAKSLTLIMRNAQLSEMISREFSNYSSPEYPVTADKLIDRIKWLPEEERTITLYMNYEVIGGMNRRESGIFDFFRAIPVIAQRQGIGFTTPSEVLADHKAVDTISVHSPISISGEEKSTNDWTGNNLQQGVIDKLQLWGERVRLVRDRKLIQDWLYLQSSDHLYYMNTSGSGRGFSPYNSAYDAFNNYMNVLSDLLLRVEELAPRDIETEELNSYQQTIQNQDVRIKALEAENTRLKGEILRKSQEAEKAAEVFPKPSAPKVVPKKPKATKTSKSLETEPKPEEKPRARR